MDQLHRVRCIGSRWHKPKSKSMEFAIENYKKLLLEIGIEFFFLVTNLEAAATSEFVFDAIWQAEMMTSIGLE